MKYFVTGATGFVGGRVTRMLLEAGHQVVAIVRDPEKAKDLADLGVILHKGDVTDKESMRVPMQSVDGVFHIAGWYKVGLRDKSDGERVNVQGTRNILELMKELGIPKGVYTSTIAINSNTHGKLVDESYYYDGPHISEYDRTKWVAHHQVAEPMIKEGLPLVIVMPGVVYGPGDTSELRKMFIRYLKRKQLLLPRETAYSWSYIDDVAWAHIAAMEKGKVGESYSIAGPTDTLIAGMKVAEKITGVPIPRLQLSPGAVKRMAAVMGVIEKVVPLPPDYTSEYIRVSAGVTYIGDNAKARRELGYNPRSIEEGMTETMQHEMRLLGMKK